MYHSHPVNHFKGLFFCIAPRGIFYGSTPSGHWEKKTAHRHIASLESSSCDASMASTRTLVTAPLGGNFHTLDF